MAAQTRWVADLASLTTRDESRVGGKAARLGALARRDISVPKGFCLTVDAYDAFVQQNSLDRIIRLELSRKSLSDMRWEEMWDAALRIRSAFNAARIPSSIASEVRASLNHWPSSTTFAVRSSAPGEDSRQFSFAGLHESVIGIRGAKQILDAIRHVWASLWSDAALLYRKEIGLDPAKSRMAVLVQAMVVGEKSGVAFGRDPRQPRKPLAIVEAVPGLCQDLVDGTTDPDRFFLSRTNGKMLESTRGNGATEGALVLSGSELKNIYRLLVRVENACGWPPDMEWTQKNRTPILLQARPITNAAPQKKDDRSWYMSLKPGENRLRALRQKITGELLPELEKTGEALAGQQLSGVNDRRLAEAIRERQKILSRWRKIYWDEFIPFAHGVRKLATFYNDNVKPSDPYEFVGLLKGETTLASRRMKDMSRLAKDAFKSKAISRAMTAATSGPGATPDVVWTTFVRLLGKGRTGARFLLRLRAFLDKQLDMAYGSESLQARPDLVFHMLKQMAERRPSGHPGAGRDKAGPARRDVLEKRLLRLAGKTRKRETEEILSTARLSWRLRDDDNVLLGRIENQLLRALQEGAKRLRAEKRWPTKIQPMEPHATGMAKALTDPTFRLSVRKVRKNKQKKMGGPPTGEKPRQMVGQPVAPGMAIGKVRRVSGPGDMALFRAGEILVCDAIQPSITHLVPLAAAIVERRGGMLMHGAIVARELGRPCVNGIPNAMERLENGEEVTVDGHLGIVTVGKPELDLEKSPFVPVL